MYEDLPAAGGIAGAVAGGAAVLPETGPVWPVWWLLVGGVFLVLAGIALTRRMGSRGACTKR